MFAVYDCYEGATSSRSTPTSPRRSMRPWRATATCRTTTRRRSRCHQSCSTTFDGCLLIAIAFEMLCFMLCQWFSTLFSVFPECVAKGACCLLLSGGLGAGPCSFRFWDCARSQSFTPVNGRARSRTFAICPMRVPLGFAWTGSAEICVAVPWGLVVGVSCPMRCALVIGGDGGRWVALCRWDCCGGRRVGKALPL